jgi:hypothetical protein
LRLTAELLLAALGTRDGEHEDENLYAVAGAMALAEGLHELTALRRQVKALTQMIAKALSR